MEYALKLSNVCKEYDSSEFALDNVTFDLPTGTVMGFVGRKWCRENNNNRMYFKYSQKRQRVDRDFWKRNE